MLDDLAIGQIDVLDHEKSGCTHYWWHDLAVRGGSHFDRPRLHRRVADALHQHDGYIASGEYVGHGRTGNHAVESRSQHRCLGRPAAHVAHQRERHTREIVAGAGLVEHGAEQHVQEDEAGRHPQRHAEHAFGGNPEVRGGASQRRALVRDQVRHITTGKYVDEADDAHDHHWLAQAAPTSLEQRKHADDGNADIHAAGRALAPRERTIEQKQITGAKGRHQRQHPVVQRHVFARAAVPQRKSEIDEEHGEGQMNRPRHGIVEHHVLLQARIQLGDPVREGRGYPQLEQRPQHCDVDDQEARQPLGLARARLGGDDLFDQIRLRRAGLIILFHPASSQSKRHTRKRALDGARCMAAVQPVLT